MSGKQLLRSGAFKEEQ
ncbi:hypothetical protein D043_0147A, partial [Vibrio parahaemolyticus EKP-021]